MDNWGFAFQVILVVLCNLPFEVIKSAAVWFHFRKQRPGTSIYCFWRRGSNDKSFFFGIDIGALGSGLPQITIKQWLDRRFCSKAYVLDIWWSFFVSVRNGDNTTAFFLECHLLFRCIMRFYLRGIFLKTVLLLRDEVSDRLTYMNLPA